MNGNLDLIWQLIAGGLVSLPSSAMDLQYFVETVWNEYTVGGDHISSTNRFFAGGYYVNAP